MLREDGLVKVLDFGLAKLTQKKDGAPFDSQAPTLAQVETMPGRLEKLSTSPHKSLLRLIQHIEAALCIETSSRKTSLGLTQLNEESTTYRLERNR